MNTNLTQTQPNVNSEIESIGNRLACYFAENRFSAQAQRQQSEFLARRSELCGDKNGWYDCDDYVKLSFLRAQEAKIFGVSDRRRA